jgi:hypothetical protein
MAISGLGSGVGATLGDGATTYAQVLRVAVSGQDCDATDISSSGSADQFSEFLPGLLDAGHITCTLRYGSTKGIAADGTQTTLNATFQAREIDTWTITIPGGATWACSGFIVRLGIAVQYKGGTQQQVVIKCTGKPTFTAAS